MNIFGVEASYEKSKLVLIPVPWEVTTSYGSGTSRGPQLIDQASVQVDLYDYHYGEFIDDGIFLEKAQAKIKSLNQKYKPQALKYIFKPEKLSKTQKLKVAKEINAASEKINEIVYERTKRILADGKIAAVIGGDHSSPFGAIKAYSEHYRKDFGILHFDAHADLRDSYQGFHFSHASIMNNVVKHLRPKKLIQIGIRDFCLEEKTFAEQNGVQIYFDELMRAELLRGKSFEYLSDEIISALPENIYISFDIDGLDPALCPGTGTPVPGGLSFTEASFLLNRIKEKKKRIIGFDLCEVSAGGADNEWDANIGARILFKLCGLTLRTN